MNKWGKPLHVVSDLTRQSVNLSKSFNSGLRNLAYSSINVAINKCADSPEWLRSYSALFLLSLFDLVFYS